MVSYCIFFSFSTSGKICYYRFKNLKKCTDFTNIEINDKNIELAKMINDKTDVWYALDLPMILWCELGKQKNCNTDVEKLEMTHMIKII